MKRSGVWDAWLFAVSVGMTAFGVFMALFSRSPIFAAFNRQIDPIFWPAGLTDPAVRAFQEMIYGVWGATVAGFGALAAFIVRVPFRARQRWARDALVVAVAAWFVLDSGISALYGVWFNVGFNSAVLVALALPVGLTWKEFGGEAKVPGLPG